MNKIIQDRIFGSPDFSVYSKLERDESLQPAMKPKKISITLKLYQIENFIKKYLK